MTDLLERITADIERRLGELRPLYEEYERLTRAREALGRNGAARSPATSSPNRPSAPRRRPARSASGTKRAPRGENRRKLLAVIGERPGVSAAEAASVAGVKKPVAYTTLAKLASEGAVEKVQIGSLLGYRVPGGADGQTADA